MMFQEKKTRSSRTILHGEPISQSEQIRLGRLSMKRSETDGGMLLYKTMDGTIYVMGIEQHPPGCHCCA